MIKKFHLGLLLVGLGLAQAASAANIIRVIAPVEYVERGEWLMGSPVLGPAYDAATSCEDWLPDASTVTQGEFFEQTAQCTTTSSHTVQQQEVNSATGKTRNVGLATVESSTEQSTKTQQAVGTSTSTDTFTVINPVAGRNGIYTVKNKTNTFSAYVDMTTDGGKWVLAARWVESSESVAFNNIVVKGNALKTQSIDPTNYPVIPSGNLNTSDRVLVVSGNASWQAKYGAWQEFATFAPNTVLNSSGFPVTSPSGNFTLYHDRSAWNLPQTMDQTFSMWTVPNNSGDCGGANRVGPNRMCVVMGPGYGSHADLTSVKSLYLKAQ